MTTDPCLVGVNLPWLFGAYGHDLATNEMHPDWGHDFDAFRAYRPLVEAREMGFAAVRVWLCEKGEGIITRDGRVEAVNPELLAAIDALQDGARLVGVKVYWSLLDGNAWAREGDALTGAIAGDLAQTERFAARVAAPIAARLDPALTVGVEVINEPEALAAEGVPAGHGSLPWSDIARCVRVTGDALRTASPGLLVTAGTLSPYLSRLLSGDPRVDAVDVHAYHATAGLPSRAQLAQESGLAALEDPAYPLLAGECGLTDEVPAESHLDLQNYVYNADRLGYSAAFLWKLEGWLLDPKSPTRAFTPAGRVLRDRLATRATHRSAG